MSDMPIASLENVGLDPVDGNSGPGRAQKSLKVIAWILFGLFCLTLFTILKVPQTKVKNLIHGNIVAYLSSQGIDYTSESSQFSTLLGFRYRIEEARLSKSSNPEAAVQLDSVTVSPSLLALLTGKMGAQIGVEHAEGDLDGAFSVRGQDVKFNFQSKNVNLGKTGIFGFLSGLKGTAILSGRGEMAGDLNTPSTVNGHMQLNLNKVSLDEQNFQGFALPKINISEAVFDVRIVQGKIQVNTIKFGKPGSADDLIGTITGDGQLGRQIAASQLNMKMRFNVSQSLLKAIPLLDAILGAARQKDGSYLYNLQGNFYSLMPMPVPAQ